MEKKLYRDEFHKKLGGVCAGLAEYFTVDVAIVRILFVLACILHGGGLIVYIVLWIALPKKPYAYFDPTVDYTVPPQNTGDQATGSTGATGNSSFGNTSFGNTSFQNAPFSNNPYPNPPFQPQPRSTSMFSIIAGVILIVIGGSILLSNFDIIPDWDLEHLWPIILITIGCIFMISGNNKKKIDEPVFQKTEEDKTTNTTETNPPADDSAAV